MSLNIGKFNCFIEAQLMCDVLPTKSGKNKGLFKSNKKKKKSSPIDGDSATAGGDHRLVHLRYEPVTFSKKKRNRLIVVSDTY